MRRIQTFLRSPYECNLPFFAVILLLQTTQVTAYLCDLELPKKFMESLWNRSLLRRTAGISAVSMLQFKGDRDKF